MAFSLPLTDLFAAARTVALVQLVEGRTVKANGQWCGARYVGHVLEGIKNAKEGTRLEFGYVPELKIGAAYLVLLGDLSDAPMEQVPEFQEKCRGALPAQILVQYWRGAMEVAGNIEDLSTRSKWSVRRVGAVKYPLGTRTVVVGDEKMFVYSDLISRMKGEK